GRGASSSTLPGPCGRGCRGKSSGETTSPLSSVRPDLASLSVGSWENKSKACASHEVPAGGLVHKSLPDGELKRFRDLRAWRNRPGLSGPDCKTRPVAVSVTTIVIDCLLREVFACSGEQWL